MGYQCSHSLIDKVGPALEHRANQVVGVADQDGIGLVTVPLEMHIYHGHHAQQAQFVPDIGVKLLGIKQGKIAVKQLLEPANLFGRDIGPLLELAFELGFIKVLDSLGVRGVGASLIQIGQGIPQIVSMAAND